MAAAGFIQVCQRTNGTRGCEKKCRGGEKGDSHGSGPGVGQRRVPRTSSHTLPLDWQGQVKEIALVPLVTSPGAYRL